MMMVLQNMLRCLADLFRADGFHRQLRYPRQKFLLAPVQFRYLHIHIGKQHIVCARQTVHQLFNLAVHMGKLHLQCCNFRVCLCRFLSACQRFVACQLLYHLLINNRFQFRSDDFPAPRTTLVIQPFRTAKVLLAGGIEDAHKSIPAIPAFDFSRQPCMGSFPGRLDFHVVHQLLAAGQPDVRGDDTLMGSQHQHLVFQVVLFAGLHIPPLIRSSL